MNFNSRSKVLEERNLSENVIAEDEETEYVCIFLVINEKQKVKSDM